MTPPDTPIGPAFDRARNAAAHVRAQREAALTPDQRAQYQLKRREEADLQQVRDDARAQQRDKRLADLTNAELMRPADPALQPGPPASPTEQAARQRAEATLQRLETNERNAELQASRGRLDSFLADCERHRGARER